MLEPLLILFLLSFIAPIIIIGFVFSGVWILGTVVKFWRYGRVDDGAGLENQ